MSSVKAKDSFLKGAFILGMAGILVKVMGAFFRIPLGNLIGAEGMAYYQAAYPVYTLFLTLATAGFPTALAKLVSEKNAIGDHKGAHKIFKVSYTVLFMTGILAFLVFFFGADYIVNNIMNNYIGDQIPTSGGYYARYEGRNAVYILTKSIANTLLAPVTAIAHSMVSYPMSTTTYYQTRDFYIMRDGKMFAWIDLDESASSSSSSSDSEQASSIKYKMKAPVGFVPNSTTYSEILTKFSDFSGKGVVEIGPELSDLSLSEDEETQELLERIKEYGNVTDIDISSEEYQYLCVEQITTLMRAMFGKDTLDKYGLYEPETVLHYTYNGVESFVLFGDEQDDGYRYAYSALWNTIVAFDPDDLDFLEWGLLQYVDKSLFSIDITTVKQLTFKSDEISETFDFGVDAAAQTITVTPQSTGEVFGANQLYNFRSFYRSLLAISLEGYAESTTEDNLMLSFEIRTYDGTIYDFKFYRYSTRRCYYTINGTGEFYVLSDSIDKVISDCKKLMNSQDVDSWAKN